MLAVCGSFKDLRVSKKHCRDILAGAFLSAGVWLVAGCGGEEKVTGGLPEGVSGDVFQRPQENKLGGLPGGIYRSQADSAINWQPWTKDTLKLAKDSNRLVLAVIALPQQPSFFRAFRELEKDPVVVDHINNSYVPVLIDGDAARELGILTADLCAEIGSGLQLPLMLWMTPDANPVAWIPLPSSKDSAVPELFSQSHVMVGHMWTDDPAYVSKNSAMDQRNRRARMLERIVNREISVEPGNDAIRALRQLTSLYDPVSRTFDEAGGLFPCGAMDLLALGARMDGLPEDLREKSRTTAGYLLDDLLNSAMFDPLDGSAFSSRRGSTWALPGFYRDCVTQARIVNSLLSCFEVTGDKRGLYRAMGVLDFIERKYSAGNGLFTLGVENAGGIESWLWREDDIRPILTGEELELWMEATGMESMGNLPSEVDPFREFFRANSIAFVKTPEEIAGSKDTDPTAARELYESARRKLLKARNERMEHESIRGEANAAATFRVVSAYASAYRITGDETFRKKAVTTLEKAKSYFSHGPGLVLYENDSAVSLVAGRAFLYGLALQATLDVAAITLDETWLLWADDLATTTAELFGKKKYIAECPPEADLIGLPVFDFAMLFGESTAGLLGMDGARLAALGRPFLEVLETQATKLPMASLHSPILHTDAVQATLIREYGITYIYGTGISEESKAALSRKPLKGFNRGPEGHNHAVRIEVAPSEILRIRPGEDPAPVKELD